MKLVVWTLLVLFGSFVRASSGDRLPEFQQCVSECKVDGAGCPNGPRLALVLILTGWTCEANCRYQCTHTVTQASIKKGGSVHQFYGKWPFARLLGMQEPASVLFSALNGYAHYCGHKAILRLSIVRSNPFKRLYLLNARLCMFGWLCSAFFHSRDLPTTEKLDYFSAVASLLFNAYISISQLFKLADTRRKHFRRAFQLACILFLSIHISYLTLWDFDYAYNMAAGITIGMLSNLGWLLWTALQCKRRRYACKIVAFVVLISCAMALEVLDFPPVLWVLDAHALWHAATVPLVFLLYSFFLDDLRFEESGGALLGKDASE